ncbi:MAG: PAS domain-containing protein [Deltaproteobacteria bacterium]|nr:PAS domain-containing protein [Deltaproteobacteria bacterium]
MAAEQSPPTQYDPQQLRSLLDGITDAAVVVSRDLKPLAWNAAYAETVGLGAKSLAREAERPGTRCRDLYGLEVCDSGCLGARTFNDGRSVRVHEIHGQRVKNKDDDQQTLIVSTIPLRDPQGNVWAVLETYRDVTAEARIQDRYKVLLDNERRRAELLEEQVKARTADLQKSLDELRSTRAQLIQSEKLSSLGKLVAGVAHEINNPINFIYGNLDFLDSHVAALLKVIGAHDGLELPEEQAARIRAVETEVDLAYVREDLAKLTKSIRLGTERVAGIVRDLRQVCHRSDDNMGRVRLPECIERALNLISHNTKDRVAIVRNYNPTAPEVWGNEGRLNQVFMNILINGVQAIPKKGQIEIVVHEEQGGVATEITDNGVGIPEDLQLKIFDPFFTTKPVGEGTGLGLSITYSIVNAHNGKISVKSEVGKFTTFTVWLPSADSVAASAGAVA